MRREHKTQINGVSIRILEYGPSNGKPLICLHGFPDFSYGWRHQIPFFEEQGFRLLTPDQRGYNCSDKPTDLSDYSLETLSADILSLMDHFQLSQAALIGHDWGGILAWWLGAKHPERFTQVAIISAPHPSVLSDHLIHNRTQLRKSWYFFAFQIPWIPERVLSSGNFTHFQQSLNSSTRQSSITPTDLEKYRAAWAQPGAMTAMLNWYRSLFRLPPQWPKPFKLNMPTLLVYGQKDPHLGEELAEPSLAYCSQGTLEIYPQAGHFPHWDAIEEFNQQLLDFLNS